MILIAGVLLAAAAQGGDPVAATTILLLADEAGGGPVDFTGWWAVHAETGTFQRGVVRLEQQGQEIFYERRPETGLVTGAAFTIPYPDGGYLYGSYAHEVLSGAYYIPPSLGGPEAASYTATRYAGPSYEAWSGNTAPPQYYIDYSFFTNQYTKLGAASGTTTFNSTNRYFFLLIVTKVELDAIQGSWGEYWEESMKMDSYRSGVTNFPNVYGAPDGQVATIGLSYSAKDYRGYLGFKNVQGWSNVTAILGP